jgi:hypothetical protein
MAAKPRWWRHIPEIRSLLADVPMPVVDRAAIERLFGLRRRQAIDLMSRFGGYQAGRTFLITRDQLLAQLDAVAAGNEYQQEAIRRDRVASSIESIQRTRQSEAVRIPVSAEVFGSRLQTLGSDVRLRPGKLEIEFAGAEDLLGKLFGLAQAALNDYAAFERAAVGNTGDRRLA